MSNIYVAIIVVLWYIIVVLIAMSKPLMTQNISISLILKSHAHNMQ